MDKIKLSHGSAIAPVLMSYDLPRDETVRIITEVMAKMIRGRGWHDVVYVPAPSLDTFIAQSKFYIADTLQENGHVNVYSAGNVEYCWVGWAEEDGFQIFQSEELNDTRRRADFDKAVARIHKTLTAGGAMARPLAEGKQHALIQHAASNQPSQPRTQAEKATAYEAWNSLPTDDRPELETWLDVKFGSSGSIPKVARRTFYGWKRFVKTSTKLAHF